MDFFSCPAPTYKWNPWNLPWQHSLRVLIPPNNGQFVLWKLIWFTWKSPWNEKETYLPNLHVFGFVVNQTSTSSGFMSVFGGANDSCINSVHFSPIGAPLSDPDTLMHRLTGAGSDGCYTQRLIQQLPPPRCDTQQLLMEEIPAHQLRLVAYPIIYKGL